MVLDYRLIGIAIGSVIGDLFLLSMHMLLSRFLVEVVFSNLVHP